MTTVKEPDLGVRTLPVRRFADGRGWFAELFHDGWLRELGIDATFVQDNASSSIRRYTLRGLHAQRAPMLQAKLILVLAGAVFDVAVDCRRGSPTYGAHRSFVLSAEEPAWLYVPRGFCHGFLALRPETMILYKVDGRYSPEHETGLRWDDPALGIDWPLDGHAPILSERDRSWRPFADFVPL
jgi:dTDP-4-dehydrorhamnose 3,5-epimerase